MSQSARQIAELASCQTFINCYLKEVDPGQWYESRARRPLSLVTLHAQGTFLLELTLFSQKVKVVFDVSYRSLVGRHSLERVWTQRQHQEGWQEAEWLSVVLMLVRELYLVRGGHLCDALKLKEAELLYRILDSYQLMTRYIAERQHDTGLYGDRFIDSEQSMLYGHWSHPTPKSRQGMVDWQQPVYSPEMRGRFQLHYVAVKRSLVVQGSCEPQSAEHLIKDMLQVAGDCLAISPDDIPVPLHPLQAQWLLHRREVQQALEAGFLRDLGRLGAFFTPTSSVRTLYSEQMPYMLKLSIPVKVTNSLRFNQRHELRSGCTMANLLKRSGFCEKYTRFSVIADPAYISVDLPSSPGESRSPWGAGDQPQHAELRQQTSGFEVILRTNPFTAGQDIGIHAIAALVQEPLPQHTSRLGLLIRNLATNEGRPPEQVARDWFLRYWECSVECLIRLYDEQGIALEAHQQNSLLDVSQGYPCRYYYRDNQGFYLSKAYAEHLCTLDASVNELPELFFDEQMIRNRFSYYLVANQLFSVIHRLGADGLLKEEAAISLVLKRLVRLEAQLKGVGRELVRSLLSQKMLPYKGNLLTRLQDVDELTADLEQAVYTQIKNPLAIFSYAPLEEVVSEVA